MRFFDFQTPRVARALLALAGLSAITPFLASSSRAQVSYISGVYTETFNGLASSGTATIPFLDNETLPGWYAISGDSTYTNSGPFSLVFPATPTASADNYRVGTGSSNTGSLYSYGVAGAGAVTDRALGSVGSGTPPDFYYGVAIRNDSGTQLAGFTVTYDGEQWRRGANGSATAVPETFQRPETLYVYYRIGGTALNASGTWTAVTDLNFTSPNANATDRTEATLDGNAAGNRVAGITATITVPVPANETVWILWVDVDNAGSDHGMAIDNFNFTGVTATVGAPVITSSTTASTIANATFLYAITATQSPTSYGATGLPAGLSLNSATGEISGAATTPGSYSVAISATNSSGTGAATLALTVDLDPNAPVVTADQSIGTVLNAEMTPYQVLASNSPTSYSSGALPAGLELNPTTGVISGAPTVAGTFTVAVTATNASGSGVANVRIAVNSAPIVTSELSASAYVGQPFTYTLVVDEQTEYPTSGVVWTGLPDGVAKTTAKVITGTPSTPGTYTIGIAVSNDLNGMSTTNVTLTLKIIDQAMQDAIPVSVVVNEFVNGTPDRVELLVIGNGTAGSMADLRGMILKDFSGSLVSDNGGKYVFASNSLWSAVPAGTLIVLSNGTTQTEDLVVSDYVLRVNLGNTTYFTSVGTFDIATAEMVMIKAAGYGTLGVAGGIHALANGVANPLPADTALLKQYRDFTGKKLSATGSNGATPVVLASNSTSALVDFTGVASSYASLDATVLATSTLGAANNTTNQVYIDSLRAAALSPIEEWRLTNFGISTNTGTAADSADFDNDGIPNLIEYATGTEPDAYNVSAVVQGRDGDFLTLSYTKISDASLTYTVQATSDLAVAFTTGAGSSNTSGGITTYKDNVSLSTAGVRRFLRLEVTRTE